MGNVAEVKGIKIGEGIPKICVPIVGKTKKEILLAASSFRDIQPDIVEWRVDWFDDVFDSLQIQQTAEELRNILGNTPILFTFRTAKEGGERVIDAETYALLNKKAAQIGLFDLIDVEAFAGDVIVQDIIENVHKAGVKVIASNHDFDKTPDKEEIIKRLCKMQELGADICKIAVMPQSEEDVLTLLAATQEMSSQYARTPIVTMSMGKMGLVSRLCGEIFGSAITFGAIGQSSAPGQMNAVDLKTILTLIH